MFHLAGIDRRVAAECIMCLRLHHGLVTLLALSHSLRPPTTPRVTHEPIDGDAQRLRRRMRAGLWLVLLGWVGGADGPVTVHSIGAMMACRLSRYRRSPDAVGVLLLVGCSPPPPKSTCVRRSRQK